MSERKTLVRKLIYGAVIVVLFVPLSMMSQPATKEEPGGTLAELRRTYKLSQAELGDIDPSSATMKLATMGLGGVAVNLLWERANEYKMKEDWIALGATLEQIVKLQPHFYKVWDFQAHNLSYNISAEFDDYHDRYTYVIRGINFLKQGFEKNDTEPRLLNRIGWYIGQKIGRSDEYKQYRRLFREDWNNLFHATDNPDRTPEERDNWLVSREYHRQGEALADTLESRGTFLKTTPLLFYSEAPKAQINYAEARQLEGRFIEPEEQSETKRAWEIARDEWLKYGQRPLPTSFGITIRLQDLEDQTELAAKLTTEIEAMLPGERERLHDEKLAVFPADVREAIRTPYEHRTHDQMALAGDHEYKAAVSWDEVADQAPADQRAEAKRLSNALIRAEGQINAISTERGKVNYEYWRTRGEAEAEELTMEARQLTYQAGANMDKANVDDAIKDYEEAWIKWREVIDRYPRMAGESVSADELLEDINRYKKALSFYGKSVPQPFLLQDVIDVAEMKIIYTPDDLAKKEREADQKAAEQAKQNDE